jgi:hypothetical protein
MTANATTVATAVIDQYIWTRSAPSKRGICDAGGGFQSRVHEEGDEDALLGSDEHGGEQDGAHHEESGIDPWDITR